MWYQATSLKLPDTIYSCSDTCDSTCQQYQYPIEYTSNQYFSILIHVMSQKYYLLCTKSLCMAEGQR